jgi:iron complex outermembrane receptor protein
LEGFTSTGTSENKAAPAAFNGQGIPYLIPANQNPLGTCNGCDLYGYRDGPSPYVESVNDAGTIQKRPRTAAVTLEQGLTEHVKLYSISSYTEASENYREDTDGTPNYVFFNEDHTYEHTYTQELRLQGDGASMRWTTGVYAMDIDGTYFIENGIPTICDPLNTTTCIYAGDPPLDGVNGKGAVSGSYYRLETRSIAGYAQGEYDFTSQLTGVVGARVTHDANYFDYSYFCTQTEAGACTAIFGAGLPTSVKNIPSGVYHLSQDHNLPSGKVGLNYKVTPDILTYVSLNRGVKGAGYIYSYDGTLPLSQLSFRPERLTSLEGGIKSGWWDHRITADLSLFHYHYKDFQTFQFSGVSATVVNKDALANGGELELNAKPGAGFALNVGVAYDNMWVHGIPTFNGVIEDQRAINAPVWQVNWGIAKTWQLPDDSTFRIGYDGRYTGERWFNIVNEAVLRDPPDTIHDVDFTLTSGSHFSYRGYITNFTNKAVANVRFDQTAQGFVLTHWDPPRMWGLAVDYKF